MELKDALRAGEFIVTSDFLPPKGTDIKDKLGKLLPLKGKTHGINAADNQKAVMSLSSLATSYLIKEMGFDPIMQIVCRDRNRLSLQSDLLGAAALGIKNILVLTGDHQSLGDHPSAKGVFDLDSVQLLKVARTLETGFDMSGNTLKGSPSFCLGAALNPMANPLEPQIIKMEKKIRAGAEFFQTQPIFDVDRLKHLNVPVLAGIFLIKSARMANFMNRNVPGVNIPDFIVKEFEGSSDPVKTSIKVAARIIREVRNLCRGVHIMTINWEDRVPMVLEEAGL
jgi:5,10-methylenetetrahydrofolate reductase